MPDTRNGVTRYRITFDFAAMDNNHANMILKKFKDSGFVGDLNMTTAPMPGEDGSFSDLTDQLFGRRP